MRLTVMMSEHGRWVSFPLDVDGLELGVWSVLIVLKRLLPSSVVR